MGNYLRYGLENIIKGVDYGTFYRVLKARPEVIDVLCSYEFNEAQTKEIVEAFDKKLSLDQIVSCAIPRFNSAQMNTIYNAYKYGLSVEQMAIVMDYNYSIAQMRLIIKGLQNGWSEELIPLYARSYFSVSQMEQIYLAINDGLGVKKIKLFANPEFSPVQMKIIRMAFSGEGLNLSYDQVKLFANPTFSAEKMTVLKQAYEKGLTIKQVRNVARIYYTKAQMEELIEAYYSKFTDTQMAILLNRNLDAWQMFIVRKAASFGLSDSEIAIIATGEYGVKHMEIIIESYRHGVQAYVELLLNPKLNSHQADVVWNFCKYEQFSIEQLVFLANPDNDHIKMKEIACWFGNGFSIEQLKEYVEKFNSEQLAKIRYGLRNKIDYFDLWVNPEFKAEQMQEIITGIEAGLSEKQLRLYAYPKIEAINMAEIRSDILNGISYSDVEYYAECTNTEIYKMRRKRILFKEIRKLIN